LNLDPNALRASAVVIGPWSALPRYRRAKSCAERSTEVTATYADYRDLRPADPDGLQKWRADNARREEEFARERSKLDVVPPTLADIDQRIEEWIDAEREMMIGVLGDVIAQFKHDEEWKGPPGPAGPRGEQGPPGKLPLVKLWKPETVFYEGDVVAYDGGAFQAKRDTGQPPPHAAHWLCLATAGRDGSSVNIRGTFDANADYRRLDVVALNGGSFIALRDAPGPCPGSGWQLLAGPGRRGAAGEKGERGPPGPRGDPGLSCPTIREWKIDRERYVATPVMSDGREGPPLELRGLFEQFFSEVR
jgi:hypothetical protein